MDDLHGGHVPATETAVCVGGVSLMQEVLKGLWRVIENPHSTNTDVWEAWRAIRAVKDTHTHEV